MAKWQDVPGARPAVYLKDTGCTWSARLVCWSHNRLREEKLLQQAWTPLAPGAPAHGLHQTLPFPFPLVSELGFNQLPSLKHAQRSRMRLLCWQPCESQHKTPMCWGAGGWTQQRQPEDWAECGAPVRRPLPLPLILRSLSGGKWPQGQPPSTSLSGSGHQDLNSHDESLSLLLEGLDDRTWRKLENGGHPLVSVSF